MLIAVMFDMGNMRNMRMNTVQMEAEKIIFCRTQSRRRKEERKGRTIQKFGREIDVGIEKGKEPLGR